MKEKKVMQHYFWNWLTHNFCHTLERWGRYYRMGSFKIFAEVVRFFFLNQSVFYASLFHSAIKEIYIDYWNFKNKFLFPKEFRLTKSWKSLICKWVVKGRRIWQHLTVLAIQPPLPGSMILKSIKQKKNN